MSAAAGGAGASAANAAGPPPLELHRIPLTPFRENHAQYVALFKRALHSDNDDELGAMRPTTDEEYYRFFILAVAKELKYIVNSDMFPHYMHKDKKMMLIGSYNTRVLKKYYDIRTEELTKSLRVKLKNIRGKLRRMFGALPSTAEQYVEALNSIFRKREPWGDKTPEKQLDYYDSYLESSVTVLQESLRVIKNGHPLWDLYKDVPTTLFLYCRRTPEGQPLYAGHIFTQVPTGVPPEFVEFLGVEADCPDPATLPYTLFISIYKSLFDEGKALSTRIFADVEAYARERRCALMTTIPLPNMDKILERHHFRKFTVPRVRKGRYSHRNNEEGGGGDPVYLRGLGSGGKVACGAGNTGRSTGSSGSTGSSKSRSASAGTRRSSHSRSTGGRRRTKRRRR